MVDATQSTLGAINNAVVEEFKKRDILPDNNDPGSLNNFGITHRLAEHLHATLEANAFKGDDVRAEANKKAEVNSSAVLTATINTLREKAGKMPVAESLVQEAVKAGWEKAISAGKSQQGQQEPGQAQEQVPGAGKPTLAEVGANLGIQIPEPTGIGAGRFQ